MTGDIGMTRQMIRCVLAFLCVMSLSGLVGAAGVAKNTPFGVTFTTANFQHGVTLSDQIDTFKNASQVGSTIMFVYLWGTSNATELNDLGTRVAIARQFGLKVFIQFSSVARGKPTPPDGLPETWTRAETRDRYVKDVMQVARLKPDYLNVSPEVNIMAYFQPDEFNAYKGIYPNLYTKVKLITPSTRVGVSYLDLLWVGRNQAGLPDELGTRDFIGITTYPDNVFGSVAEIPTAWYGLIRSAYPNEPIIFNEVGWGSVDPSSNAKQAEFVAALPGLFRNVKPELVIWALLHESGYFQVRYLSQDALDFLNSVGADPDVLFAKFNSVGLMTANGTKKPAWYEAMLLNFSTAGL